MKDYFYFNDYFQNIDAMVTTCGYESCAPGHSYGPAVRDCYLIHYVTEGRGVFRTDGKEYRLEGGEAFFIRPGTLIYYAADRKKPWTYTWIGFQGIKIRQYLERTSLFDAPVFGYGEDGGMRLCHEKMYEANRLCGNRDLMMNSILYEYLFLLAERFPKRGRSVKEKGDGYVEEALKYVEANYSRNMSVQDVAGFLNIDRSYLHRLFKGRMGVSLQEYLVSFRLRRACGLLDGTDFSVAAIARSVGYEDALYFSRLFRTRKGCAPSEWRKRGGKKREMGENKRE